MKSNKKTVQAAKNELVDANLGDFNNLLDAYAVESPDGPIELNHEWVVSHENTGIIATFLNEKDAYLFRLMKINIELNGK